MKQLDGDWLEIAKSLRVDTKTRTVCTEGCGSDESQIVSHDHKGFSRYCFRCGAKAFESHGERNIAAALRHRLEEDIRNAPIPILPSDYTTDVPAKFATWYYRYGITAEVAREYGIGYSTKMGRIVLPVFGPDGKLQAMQLRAVQPDQEPKYLNTEGQNTGKTLFLSGAPIGITVLVEDYLSAIKVGKVTHATSILGTKLTDARILQLARDNHTVIIWLDPDIAGMRGRKSVARQLRLLGVTVYQVYSDKDPKYYTKEEIEQHLRRMKRVN